MMIIIGWIALVWLTVIILILRFFLGVKIMGIPSNLRKTTYNESGYQ